MPNLVHNNRLHFDYDIVATYQAGIVLSGAEVKSCKLGQVSLQGAYIVIQQNRAWLKNMRISPYQINNQPGYDPIRLRPLLMHKSELRALRLQLEQPGLTVLPESLYTKGGFVKVAVALVRGRKKFDKRALIKKRDVNKRIAQAMRRS